MEQQAGVLRSFLAQLERQEAVDEEAPNGIAGEFVRLKTQSTKYRTDKTFPTKTAEKQDNIKKNRYKDIVPFDHSRVKLTLTTSKNDTDYINASFIKGVSGSRAYIATQGPLPHTLLDFFRMLWEYDVKVVVMACREFEMGKKKCERYWPHMHEPPLVCESFTVYCDSEELKGDYLTRMLRVTYRNCSRTMMQLHYVNWPDHGVPDSIPPILEMLQEMRSYQDHDDIPICIHCSAGCGRTGALCVIDFTWNLLKRQMITSNFSIFDLVQNMRTQRPSLVQTKEQYELVYRTIKVLFQRYLESMDAQTCRDEVSVVPSAPDPGSDFFDSLSEELDLLPEFQHLLDEERDLLPLYNALFPSASKNFTPLRPEDTQWDQQQWHRSQTLPDALTNTQGLQDGRKTAPKAAERTQESDDTPPLKPPPPPQAVEAAMCLMVEDPYFDTLVSSPSSEEASADFTEDKAWLNSPILSTPSLCLNDQTMELNTPASDEEDPPPLPQRTPESYVLAVDAEPSEPCERLMVIIPPNAAAEAVRDLGGNPPSPVPPLPERTPESFELAIDEAPVEPKSEVTPASVNLRRLGMSSEWSGNSNPAATATQNESKPWVRSKSLKVKMTFSVPVSHCDAPRPTSSLLPYCPPPDSLTPRLPPRSEEESLTPPLPDRTPESFLLITEQTAHEAPAARPPASETTRASPRVGMSSEWDGTSQPKKFLDVVMSRSKSVRAKSSRQEPLTAARQITPPPEVLAGGGSAQAGQRDVSRMPSLNTETSGSKSDKSNEKGMSRSRSLKFFRHKQKPKTAPPPPPTQPGSPPPSYGASFSGFKFGFGNRFGKPKGPRSYPEAWI